METNQVNLKEMVLSTFKKKWKEDHQRIKNEIKAREEELAIAEEQFKTDFPEFYQVLWEAGLYNGIETILTSHLHEPVVVIGNKDAGSMSMRIGPGVIQPEEGSPFRKWELDRLLEVVGSKLKIISDEELDEEYARYQVELGKEPGMM